MDFPSNHLWFSSASLQTNRHSTMSHHSRTRTFLDHFHWVTHLQHQLVAFNSRVCCLFLIVNSCMKIILSDLSSTCNVLLSPAVLTLLVDWDQCFTALISQSLVITPAQFFIEQDTGISHISYDLDLRLIDLILISKILCLGLRHFHSRFMLMITFDLSWADTFKFFSQTLSLTSTRFSACCSPAVGFALLCSRGSLPWLFCFTGSRVPSLAVSLSSRPFGSCFIQPTIHPLGLKACVVHDRFIQRRSDIA